MRGNNQRREGGENRRGSKIKISYTSYEKKKNQQNNKWATDTKRMAK